MLNCSRFLAFIIFLSIFIASESLCKTWDEVLGEARVLAGKRDYDSAIVIATMALEEARRSHGDIDSSTALVLHRMGAFHHQSGSSETQSYYEQALAIWEALPEPQPANMAKTLGNLGLYLINIRNFDQGIRYLDSALTIKRQVLPANHRSLGSSLSQLGKAYHDQGNYVTAQGYYLEAVDILKNIRPLTSSYAIAINNLADVCLKTSRYREAEKLWLEVLEIYRSWNRLDHASGVLGNLAIISMADKNYEKAEDYCLKGLALQDSLPRPDLARKEQLLKNLGLIYRKNWRLAEAEQWFLQSLELCTTLYERNHPEYIKSQYNLANIYRDLKKYSPADSLYQEVLRKRIEVLGPRHLNVARTYLSLAKVKQFRGDSDQALALAKKSFDICLQNFHEVVMVLAEKDALRYSSQLRASGLAYLTYYIESGMLDVENLEAAAEIILNIKGPVSDEILRRHRVVSENSDSLVLDKAERYRQALAEMAREHISGQGERSDSVYEANLDALAEVVKQLESELARECISFTPLTSAEQIRFQTVGAALQADACLVEYLIIDIVSRSGKRLEDHVLVLIIDKHGPKEITLLESADQIRDAITDYRKHFMDMESLGHLPTTSDLEAYNDISYRLYDLIWKPLEESIDEYNTIFLAPDGDLNLVSFAGLKNMKGKYLVEDIILHYLDAGRDIVRLRQQDIHPSNGLLAIGDPDYDASPDARTEAKENSNPPAEDRAQPTKVTYRGPLARNYAPSDITVASLPGSRFEVERVMESWPEETAGPEVVLMGASASEDNFVRLAPGNRIIHLATHGYYSPLKKPTIDNEMEESRGEFENPLLFSGLFLAGGNLHGSGAVDLGLEDGILTAEEIRTLNLKGTQVVTLSACESGHGDIWPGEGVYGLRRAFQIAGARTVVSSLWKIPDWATAEFMSKLYTDPNVPVSTRIREMQLAKIADLRSQGISDHPYSWAAFIAIGDWE